MDRLAARQTFVRVVERGSFSAVARSIRATLSATLSAALSAAQSATQIATQSAISKQVATLERVLGARLLSRTTRALALTEEGERCFEHARRLVADLAEAERNLRQREQQRTGWLRQPTAAKSFGPPSWPAWASGCRPPGCSRRKSRAARFRCCCPTGRHRPCPST